LGLARDMKLQVGSEFRVVLPLKDDLNPNQFRRKIGVFKVSGILDLGKYDYNARMILTSLSTTQKLAEINGRRGYILRAPSRGRVTSLQATPGQVADTRRLQLEIVPVEAELQAHLLIPARAIGFVRPGQQVRLLYDAFPYQNFGAYGGHILNISETLITGNDAAGPVALNEPVYRAIVELNRPDIDAYGKAVPLQPDMMLKADIIIERRRLAQWLLDPLLSARM